MSGTGRSRRAEQAKQSQEGRHKPRPPRAEQGVENSTQEAGGVAIDTPTPNLDTASHDIFAEPVAAQPAHDTSWSGMLGGAVDQDMGTEEAAAGFGQQARMGVMAGAGAMSHLAWTLLPESTKAAVGSGVDVEGLFQAALQRFGLGGGEDATPGGHADHRRAAGTRANRDRLRAARASAALQDIVEPTAPIPGNVQSRADFVREAVLENSVTERILNTIWRYFPQGTLCIGGYLDDSDQSWKVNWNYEAWIWSHEDLKKMGVLSEEDQATLASHRAALEGNAPSGSGYLHDSNVGDTADTSTNTQVLSRHSTLASAKRDLKRIVRAVDTSKSANSGRLTLAGQVIAAPGKSKHGTGYAVDLLGSNTKITEVAEKLGATSIYDEDYHMHVEFAAGVDTSTLDEEQAANAE